MADDNELFRLGRKAKRAVFGGDTNLPLEDEAAEEQAEKQKKYNEQQKQAAGHLRKLLKGDSSSIISENTKTYKSRGKSDTDAAAMAIRDARRKKDEDDE